MKPSALFLLIASAAALTACGPSDQTATPETAPPAAEAPAPEAEAAAPAATEPMAVEPAPAEPAPAPVAAPAPAAPAVAKQTPVPAPAPAAPVPAAPAEAAPAPAPATPSVDLAHGQKIYRQACAFCHDRGVAAAPKTGDKAAWAPRIAQGMDAMYTVALRGKGAMPAKGGNPSLSEADVKAAVDYMIAQSR